MLAAVLAACGCGSAAPRTAAPGTVIPITERDFHIEANAPAIVPNGDVELSITNQGPETHELIVVRTDRSQLPLRSDGITVDEDALDSQIAGTYEDALPGSRGEVRLHLDPGHYVMFCNMAGHYLGGMHTELEVR